MLTRSRYARRAVKRRLMSMALCISWAACNGDATPGGAAPDAAPADAAPFSAQLPPLGQALLEQWLRAGHYLTWTCEAGISARRLNGAHGRHRICSNQALVDSAEVPYPVGAASVKELYDGSDRPNGYAIGVKVAPGLDEDSWYWYERTGSSPTSRPVADGVGVKICGTECHRAAPRDHVFFRAPE
jgi:hypothetical protein